MSRAVCGRGMRDGEVKGVFEGEGKMEEGKVKSFF